MNGRMVCHHAVVATMLVVCLAVGGNSRFLATANGGTERPTYNSDFIPGTRVVLLENAPTVGPGLKTGMSGIVVCCDRTDCSGRILVSWSQWRGGGDEEAECAVPPAGFYPPGSAAWVDPTQVRLGLAFDELGLLEGGPDCLYVRSYEGGLYRLMVSAEFREVWWVAKPGARFHVRGLLSAGAPDPVTGTCDRADGNIYHPILIPDDWGTEPESWDRSPFHNGDRVVLVSNANPYGAANLPRGATGTVMCHNLTVERCLLVSWDLWSNSGNGDTSQECQDRYSGLFEPDSTWWVSKMDVAKYYETKCGALEQTQLCCDQTCTVPGLFGLFVPFQDVFCLPDIAVTGPVPEGRYRAIGMWSPYEELMNPQATTPADPALRDIGGIILDSLVVPCPPPSCCNPPYKPGNRVRLLVNEPGGAKGLFVGHGGTVMCCNPNDPITPILVSWDNWTGGHNDDAMCVESPSFYMDNSGWWMACTEIQRVVLPELFDRQEYRRFMPQTLAVGKHLKISGMIGNCGGADSGPFTVSLYLSRDQKISADDILLKQVSYNLAVGASMELSWLNPLPPAITPGTYYIGWIIDPDNQVIEDDETNNTIVCDGQLTVTSN